MVTSVWQSLLIPQYQNVVVQFVMTPQQGLNMTNIVTKLAKYKDVIILLRKSSTGCFSLLTEKAL